MLVRLPDELGVAVFYHSARLVLFASFFHTAERYFLSIFFTEALLIVAKSSSLRIYLPKLTPGSV